MALKLFFDIKNGCINYLNKLIVFFYRIEFKKFGKNNHIRFPIKIYGKANVSIGDNCSINSFVHIWGNGGVEIGNNVMIASNSSLTSVTHDYNALSMRFCKVIQKKIVIEDDVWIGSGSVILPGIIIGHGAVIGAGTVVTKNVPPMAIVAGNPGRIIKFREVKPD